MAALIAVVGALLWLAGCGGSDGIDKHIDRAREDREVGRLPAALIELRTALQDEPTNLTARLLFAQTFIDMSDGENAEAQILRAKQDGATDVDTARPLAEAELLENKLDDVIKNTSSTPDGAPLDLKVSLLAYRGLALAAVGQVNDARKALSEGLAQDTPSVDLFIALARLAIIDGDDVMARARLEEALAKAPKDWRLVTLHGDIAFAEQKFAEAEQAFQQRIDAQPWNSVARIDLARAQIANDKPKEAQENLDEVLKRYPDNPIVNYLRALASYRAKDYAAAQTFTQKVLALVKEFPPAELIAGAASFALGQNEQANKYLSPYVYRTPKDIQARKLLGSVQLALGHPGQAVETLSPALNQAGDDAQLLAMIGMAAARTGDVASANRYLQQATDIAPQNATIQSELAATQVALGQTDAGIQELEDAIKAHPKDLRPQLQLFLTYLGAKRYDEAYETAKQLQQSLPNDAAGFDIIGVAELAKGNIKQGREELLKAQAIRPGDYNANRNLAKLAIADGKIEAARQYYQNIFNLNPKSTPTYIDLAELEDGLGHVDFAEATLKKAVKANPDDALAHAALAKFELSKDRYQEALAAVLPALEKFPRSMLLLEAAGRARLALGQNGDAISNFKGLTEAMPRVAWTHLLLAEAYSANAMHQAAIDEANEALRLDPKEEAAQLIQARELLAANRLEQAAKVIDELKHAGPTDFATSQLDGLVAQAQGRLEDAIAAFAQAIQIYDNAVDRARLAQAQAMAGHPKDAERTMEVWVTTHGQDIESRRLLGDLYLTNGRFTEAKAEYAELLKISPKNAAVLNNMAWSLAALNRPKEALAYARDAVTVAPDSANNLDTLGVILMQNGIAAEAEASLNKAWQRSPNRTDIEFHLAQALALVGKNADAADVLRGMLMRSQSFKERDEAQKLLQKIGG